MAPSQVAGLCRRAGWRKFLSRDTGYNNEDLHDQLLPLQMYYNEKVPAVAGSGDVFDYPSDSCGAELQTRSQGREVITFGKELVTTEGGRYALAGTQSRLYLLNESTGNWQILADGLGGPNREDLSVRWQASQVLNTVILTNNYDDVLQFTLGTKVHGCEMQSVKSIPDLSLIGLSKAGTTHSYKGMVLLGDVVMDGVRYENRLIWSDFNDGTSFDPSIPNTITGTQDLPYGHKILKFTIIGDFLFIFTTKGVWRGSATGDPDAPIQFTSVYESAEGYACLSFPNTLVCTGSEIYYLSADGVYRMDIYLTEPERVEWLHLATGDMFSELNGLACAGHVGGFNAKEQEILISYAIGNEFLPSKTLVFHPKYRFASYMDAGFSMFHTYHSDRRISFRDFLRDNCICETDETPYEYLKEGLPPAGSNECETTPTVIYTTATKVVYGDPVALTDPITTEDWDAFTASDTSLCAVLGDRRADDFCLECNTEPLLVCASSIDLCLKQIGGAFSRELCLNASIGDGDLTGFRYTSFLGEYSFAGYYSSLRTAPLPFGDPTKKTTVSKIGINVNVVEQVDPPVMAVRLGKSFSPLDPNGNSCDVVWSKVVNRYFQCPQKLSAAQYRDQGLTPNFGINYPFHTVGNYIYFELVIGTLSVRGDLSGGLLPALGGDGCISSVSFEVNKQ